MKNYLLLAGLLISSQITGQLSVPYDTIKVKEVIIRGRNQVGTAGFKSVNVDSVVLQEYRLGTIAEIISENASISIKSYGNGGIATPSFRGTGAGNTQVSWNGIRIDHPMLGQSDLSILPAGMVDDINIYFGGASMKINSGGTGGIISLETKPSWKNESRLTLSPGAGSFGRYSGFISLRTGSEVFQTVTKAFFQSVENNFRYLNTVSGTEPLWETRKNSQFSQSGFIQELYYRQSANVLSARLWYQAAERNLPPSMLTRQNGRSEKQYDESIRTIINYEMRKGSTDFSFSGAWMMNWMQYSNQLASIDSRNLSDRWILKAGLNRNIAGLVNFKIILSEEYNIIRSNNYSTHTGRNSADFTISAETINQERLGVSLLVREIIDRNKFLLPDFSTGLKLKITDSKEYFLKANLSRISKIPTMNDLFWNPGGNPELENEYSFISELGYVMMMNLSATLKAEFEITGFKNSIKNMIQWHPGEFSYWSADNIKNASSSGLETSIKMDYRMNHIETAVHAGYSYTRATDEDQKDGRQLLYIPVHKANGSLRLKYKKFYYSWNADLTGRRFFTNEYNGFLPSYLNTSLINSTSIGCRYDLKKINIDINLKAENLFNVDYQTIAYYPLPGRSYFLKLYFEINKPTK